MTQVTGNIVFEEKQYIGYNRLSIVIRTLFALFCFITYYWSENPDPYDGILMDIIPYPIKHIPESGDILFALGLSISFLSIALMYVIHMHTLVDDGKLIIKGIWTSRKITIELTNIASIRRIKYSKYALNRSLYNTYKNKAIRFFTYGNSAIEIIDKSGNKYIIETQKPSELYLVLNNHKTADQ